jgi:tetratricopeptide (TPR) repeat protein
LVNDFPAATDYRELLADRFSDLADSLSARGRDEDAGQALRTSIDHHEIHVANAPEEHASIARLARSYVKLGLQRYEVDELDEESARAFRRVLELYEILLKDHTDEPRVVDQLASFLATCPAVQFRDPARAVQLVKPLLQESPRNGDLWGTLGAARHAAGEWQKAIDALEKANTLKDGGEAWDLFPLAMSQWRLGLRDEAHQTYDQAVKYVEQHRLNKDPALSNLRHESARLLGIGDEVSNDGNANSDRQEGDNSTDEPPSSDVDQLPETENETDTED